MSLRTHRIGLLFSSTGPYAVIGRSMLNGAILAAEEFNGAADATLRLEPVIADPQGALHRYPELCNEMLDAGIRHVVGCYTSSSRKELIPVVEKRDALLWYPSHYEGFESSGNVIYTGAAPNQHILPLARYALAHRRPRVFCIGSNYIWAWENNRILREVVLARGGEVLGERYFGVGEEDFQQAIDAILASQPDCVFTTLIGSSAYRFFGAFREACRARGIDQARMMPILSCSLSEPELAEIAPEARDGHVSSSVYFASVQSPANRRFAADYARRFSSGPALGADAEASYIAVRLLALALAEAADDHVAAVLAAAAGQVLAAPQGEVRLDRRTMHAFLTPRIGRSRADCGFDILHAAAAPVAPDPYLIHSTPRLEAVAAPKLRIVS